jgi:DNA-directed RNA polymerase specialized sigma24 family protein
VHSPTIGLQIDRGEMSEPVLGTGSSREALDRLLGEMRPKLHRDCARMTGSVIDGEDWFRTHS